MESTIYSLVDKNTLSSMLISFEACLDLPIQLLDESGRVLSSCGRISNYCKIFSRYLPADETCEKVHAAAGSRAVDFGETYVFSCPSNLNHIVFPLMNKHTFIGSVLVGPFLLGDPDSTLVSGLSKHYLIPPDTLFDMYDELRSIRILSPALTNQISKLLYFLFSSLISDGKLLLRTNQEKISQQSKISESIQIYKNLEIPLSNPYPYEKEKELITKVKTGDVSAAKGILNDLLGYVLFSEGSSLELIKARAIELTAILSRTAMDGGSPDDAIPRLNNKYLKRLAQVNNTDNLCFLLQEAVEAFTESMLSFVPDGKNDLVKKSIQYITRNYSSVITLENVAEHVHLNPAYFSTLFKRQSGFSFKEYLNLVRIEEAKRLLANTDYPILDIAIATGFESQSYFTKVFKKYTGLTPKQYR